MSELVSPSPTEVQGLIVPVDAHAEVSDLDLTLDGDGLARVLGGARIRQSVLLGVSALMLVDEDGFAHHAQVNPRASKIAEYFNPGFTATGLILGPAVIIGRDPQTGEPAGEVPIEVRERVLRLCGQGDWPPKRG